MAVTWNELPGSSRARAVPASARNRSTPWRNSVASMTATQPSSALPSGMMRSLGPAAAIAVPAHRSVVAKCPRIASPNAPSTASCGCSSINPLTSNQWSQRTTVSTRPAP